MKKTPSYRKKSVRSTKKTINYAVVRINGKDHILGKWNTAESKWSAPQKLIHVL